MFVDTVAALTYLDRSLGPELFQGRTTSADLVTGEASDRLYLNSGERYTPRVTWWPRSRCLRVEWSMQRMAIDEVDVFLAARFGRLPGVRSWKCQRVDYCVDLDLGERVPEYLAMLSDLQLSTWQRHPFEGQGVVWKSASRWVKFYKRDTVLRFEVSNYRDAVRYMAERWFVCERTVQEMIRPGRAIYVLAYYWERLGLARASSFDGSEVYALREAFGTRNVAHAQHALTCIRAHGAETYKSLRLMSKSSYYRWLSVLREQGFLSAKRSLSPLSLPLRSMIESVGAQNLKGRGPAPDMYGREKNLPEKSSAWWVLSQALGVNPKNSVIPALLEAYNGNHR